MARLGDLGINFEHWCFACGRQNPIGLQLEFDVSRDQAIARFNGNRQYQGYDGTLHGGIVTALLDETMGWAIFHQGIWGVTARITVTFREAVPLGEDLLVTGRVVKDRSRAIETHGALTRVSDGALLAEAEGLFMRMPEERKSELEKRYGSRDAFVRVREAVEKEEAEVTTDREPVAQAIGGNKR